MSGKDSVANILKNKMELKNKKVLITHFADLLKYICRTFFNWDGVKDEAGRQILQYVGTDIIRRTKPDYWCDFLINFLSMFKNEWDYVLIPDCRFQNEMRWPEEWDTTAVRVERLNFISPLSSTQQNHISETALDYYRFDYTIASESGLDKLEIEVNKFIKWMEDING